MISDKKKVAILEQYVDREATAGNFSEEMRFYNMVKMGQKEEIEEELKKRGFLKNEKYHLCEDPLQNMKYHLVITAAMLARFCIEGGMEYNHAYHLSDVYINRADKAVNIEGLYTVYQEMCLAYTKQMGLLRKSSVYSKPVVKSMDYIYSHLHCRITVSEIAEKIGLNENYFSRLFQKEVGIPISRYVLLKKIEVAQNMLKFSDYSSLEISELLSFSSQSHFISNFKKECHMTPREYRNLYYNNMGLEG